MANNDSEILIEHFEFSPISVIDDVIDSVNELMYQALIGLERFVEKKSKSEEEIEQGMHQVETLLETLIDHNFDMFELYVMRNIFAIPENVKIVLPHQEGMDYTLDQSKEDQIDKELELMRKKVLAAKAMNYRLENELLKTDSRIKRMERLKEKLEFIFTAPKNHNVNPTAETIRLVVDQLLAIKKITNNLHSQVNEEKMNQYANTSDRREAFVSTMVLRQTEQVKMQQRENRHDTDEDERLRKRARIDNDEETSKAIAQELKGLEMINNLFTVLNQESDRQE
ncbi:1803_t:CDS:2 [Acaulospora morrowiae]|uniref:1803_t:CDS:1 n=1 Tax=Acaulospora morrowiae TaxID=94023 RepID=A0A9N9AFE0_9GLOM|nr:1803_t:CDS:2 [Acaulospora morrowiae]